MSGRPPGTRESPRQIFLKRYKRYGRLLGFLGKYVGPHRLPRSGPRAAAMIKAAATHMGCSARTVRRDLEWLGWRQPAHVWLAQLRFLTTTLTTLHQSHLRRKTQIEAAASSLIEQNFSDRDLAALTARVRAARRRRTE